MPKGAYALEQSTTRHTLAAALGETPAGLAVWLVEKLRGWSDSGGDVESVFPREDLLTWITHSWVTDAIGTRFAPHSEQIGPVSGRDEVPTVVTHGPVAGTWPTILVRERQGSPGVL